MVLCRTNALLVKQALALLLKGRRVLIRGNDIGQALTSLCTRLSEHAPTMPLFIQAVVDYRTAKVNEFLDKDEPKRAQLIEDRCDCLLAFAHANTEVGGILRQLETLFTDANETNAILFSTIHRAKGLEADRVILLGRDMIPHPMALKHGTKEIIDQEWNLLYVAVTRAKKALTLLDVKGEAVARSDVVQEIW
jgi:superfamily I DNA/RNA helicase